MAFPLNFEQLKEAYGSNKLQHCFKFLFVQEETVNESFIMKIGEKCGDLRREIEKT